MAFKKLCEDFMILKGHKYVVYLLLAVRHFNTLIL